MQLRVFTSLRLTKIFFLAITRCYFESIKPGRAVDIKENFTSGIRCRIEEWSSRERYENNYLECSRTSVKAIGTTLIVSHEQMKV